MERDSDEMGALDRRLYDRILCAGQVQLEQAATVIYNFFSYGFLERGVLLFNRG